jgi:hypothetical protein
VLGPGVGLALQGCGWLLLTTESAALLALGIAALTGQRSVAIGLILGWQLAASKLLVSVSSLGHARDGVLSAAIDHFKPGGVSDTLSVAVPVGAAIGVIAVYFAVALGARAWRTATRDA